MSARNHPSLQRFLIANARPTGRQLGAGSYGSVEELEVSGVLCAGKKIHESLIEQGNFGTEKIVSRYVEEVQLMSDLRHPHLVQFLGVCFLPDSTLPVLVMERLLTSLDELLEHNTYIPLSLKRSILADVARGLVYLHSHSPPVIHRDLSARNVLLNSAMVAKITDLGNSRIVNFQPGQLARTLSRIPGTMVYMPPEAFEATSKYGPSLDIFSFGHLSLFTITQVFPGCLLPYTYRDPENPSRRLARTEVQRRDEYIKLLHKQLREQHPLVLLVTQCLDDEPSERLSAQELLRQLEGIRTQIEDPYQPLTKLEAIRILREKDQHIHTQMEASRTSRQALEALQTRMEELQLEHCSQLAAKEAENSRLGEDLRSLQREYSSELTAKDAQIIAKDAEIIAKDAENSRLNENLRSVQADLQAKETQIQEIGAETEQRDAEILMLTAELGDLQSQLQKAQAVLETKETEYGTEVLQKEAEIHTLSAVIPTQLQHTSETLSGPPTKKPADSGDGAKASGEDEEIGAVRMMDELPDQPEPAIAPELLATETEYGAECQQKEVEIHTLSTVIPAKPQYTSGGDSGDNTGLKRTVSVDSAAAKGEFTRAVPVWAPGTEVIGTLNFPGFAAHDLPFKRGDSLTILSKSKDPNWCKAKRDDGREGMLPCNLIQEKITGDTSLVTPSSPPHTSSRGTAEEEDKPGKPQGKEDPNKKAAGSSVGSATPRRTVSVGSFDSGKPTRIVPVWTAGTEVIGKHNFPAAGGNDLPFKRGNSLTIISRTKDPNWYKARRSDGLEGMIPHNYVQEMSTVDASSSTASITPSSTTHTEFQQAVKLLRMPWFHGELSRENATELLKPYRNGNFLVRKGKNYKGGYTLCVSYESKVEYYRIQKNAKNWVTIDEEECFENLVKLVEHYQKDADGLCCQLKYPVEKKSGSIDYIVSLQDFKDRGWTISRKSIQKKSLIGYGEFKEVWLGESDWGQKVTIMMLKGLIDENTTQQLLAEAAIMTALWHPNLVRLIGVCVDELPIYLITEYMAKGSLLDYLRSRGRAEILKVNQLNFARDVCKGMVYLESQNLVHRNLAATNVLIGDDNTAKVSDFRLTREELIKTEHREKLLVKWTAPEALREMKFSTKSDVWSFGILLWEIYSYGRVPYPYVSVNDVLSHIEQGDRMDAPGDCPDGICQIMRECWDTNPSQRPDFVQIEKMLESISVL